MGVEGGLGGGQVNRIWNAKLLNSCLDCAWGFDFRKGRGPEKYIFLSNPSISCHSSFTAWVPAGSRKRKVESGKAYRDYVRDAPTDLARGKCHRTILM